MKIQDDFNEVIINQDLVGDLSLNDNLKNAVFSPVKWSDVDNPSDNVPIIASNGVYTFSPKIKGAYSFLVESIKNGKEYSQTLTIIVRDVLVPDLSIEVVPENFDGKDEDFTTLNYVLKVEGTESRDTSEKFYVVIPTTNSNIKVEEVNISILNFERTLAYGNLYSIKDEYLINPGSVETIELKTTLTTPNRAGKDSITVEIVGGPNDVDYTNNKAVTVFNYTI